MDRLRIAVIDSREATAKREWPPWTGLGEPLRLETLRIQSRLGPCAFGFAEWVGLLLLVTSAHIHSPSLARRSGSTFAGGGLTIRSTSAASFSSASRFSAS